mgnify:CR=1 FL=1
MKNNLDLGLIYNIFKDKSWKGFGFGSWKEYCEAPFRSGGLGITDQWAYQSRILTPIKKQGSIL